MTRAVEPIDAGATVQEAATRMAELDVGAMLVGTAERLEGVLTDRDILLRVVVEGRHPAEVAVRDVMSSSLFACHPDDTVEAAFATMRERQIRRMPVLDEAGQALGIVTLSDLAKAISGPEQVQEALRDISEPHRARKVAGEAGPNRDDEEPGPMSAASF